MKNANKGTEDSLIAKRYVAAIFALLNEFERLLKPFKGGYFRQFGSEFSQFRGGSVNE